MITSEYIYKRLLAIANEIDTNPTAALQGYKELMSEYIALVDRIEIAISRASMKAEGISANPQSATDVYVLVGYDKVIKALQQVLEKGD